VLPYEQGAVNPTADAGGPVVRVIVLRTAEGLDAPLIGDTVVGGGTLAANRGAK
jgi:hypothetical protein